MPTQPVRRALYFRNEAERLRWTQEAEKHGFASLGAWCRWLIAREMEGDGKNVARTLPPVRIQCEVSGELYQDILDIQDRLQLSFAKTIALLLRLGLDAQDELDNKYARAHPELKSKPA